MDMDKKPRSVRIDGELWDRVKARSAALAKNGWRPISVSDVIRVGLEEFTGGPNMNDVYGSIHGAAAAKHTEDDDGN